MSASVGDGVGPRPLRVRLLGGFGIDGLDEHALGTRKARLLLKRLAVARGRPVSADELAEVVWGDGPPNRPHDQLSVLVSRLRSVLGSARLPRTDAGYSLTADWIDVDELEARAIEVQERLRAGDLGSALAAAHAALAIARGPLLPEEDADWVDAARPAAERLVARARLLAAEAALSVGETAAARAAAQAVLDHDPYDEAAVRIVMRSDTAAGRPGAALAAYAVLRHRLAEDLGADPARETEDLHGAILRGDLTVIGDRRGAARPFLGRDAEGALLDGLLRRATDGDSVAAVIEAEAGVGKSALLAWWTARARASALVVAGRCDELGGGLPLQPVVDGLTMYLQTLGSDAAAAVLAADAALLDPLLGRPAADRPAADRPAADRPARATTVIEAGTGRARLFGALAAVLGRAAGERPLVVVVDDLHQAASGTAEFLAFAVRRLPRVLVLAARRPDHGPDLPGAERLTVGPLTVADAMAMFGAERGPRLHQRSGGHALFLHELAAAPDDELPESIVAAVTAQLARLGDTAVVLEAAAVCGTEVDVELVAAVTGRPVTAVLDDLERAARARLVEPRGSALAFSHELIRDAVEAATSPSRRNAVHRAAVECLAARSETDCLALARHARLGGDPAVAAHALAAAAARSVERFEAAAAEELLNQALELCDAASIRLARGRLRLGRLDLAGAHSDALRAIELGAGVHGFELAGWIAYYGRDYDTALRYADEGVARAVDDELRASCLALSGRIRHARGELTEAAHRLEAGIAIAPPGIRGNLQVWHGQLLAHRGEPGAAVDEARRGLLDPHLAHPFAAGHGYFTIVYALALGGHWRAAMDAVDDLDRLVARQDDRRFPPVAANLRGWLLRGIGLVDEARELHTAAAEMAPGPTFLEAHYAAMLDLAEDALAADDMDGAAAAVDASTEVTEWTGSMFWRHRNRYFLLSDRISSYGGDHATAAEDARRVASSASGRGDRRYACRALLVAAAADARAGHPHDTAAIGALVNRFIPLGGPDGWRDVGELAAATGNDDVWRTAESLAESIVADAARRPGVDADGIARAVRRQLDSYRS